MRTFLDIGAHTGETLSVVREPRWHFDRIICFEPASACWPGLEALADERVTLCRFGLWNQRSRIRLHNPGSIAASIASRAGLNEEAIECEFEDAAQWFADNISDRETVFAKINVEGAEAEIIEQLASRGQLHRIDHLLIHLDVRKFPGLAHQEPVIRATLDASGVEYLLAETIEFGGVFRGTRNWLRWCEANPRTRDLRFRYVKRLEHEARRLVYPAKRALTDRYGNR